MVEAPSVSSSLRKSVSSSIFKQALEQKRKTDLTKVALQSEVDHAIELEANLTPSFSIDKNPCFDDG